MRLQRPGELRAPRRARHAAADQHRQPHRLRWHRSRHGAPHWAPSRRRGPGSRTPSATSPARTTKRQRRARSAMPRCTVVPGNRIGSAWSGCSGAVAGKLRAVRVLPRPADEVAQHLHRRHRSASGSIRISLTPKRVLRHGRDRRPGRAADHAGEQPSASDDPPARSSRRSEARRRPRRARR